MRAADPHTKKPRCGGAKSGLIEGLPMRATANPPIQYYSWLHAAQETRTAMQNRRFETPLLHPLAPAAAQPGTPSSKNIAPAAGAGWSILRSG